MKFERNLGSVLFSGDKLRVRLFERCDETCMQDTIARALGPCSRQAKRDDIDRVNLVYNDETYIVVCDDMVS